MAAPAAQGTAVAGDGAAELARAGEAEAVSGRMSVGEADRCGEPAMEGGGIVARRVDMALPGDHVVEAGAEPGIPGPQDAVLGGAEAAGLRALVALRAVRHGARIGGEERARHPGRLEDAAA